MEEIFIQKYLYNNFQGILKKASSNPSLNKLEAGSEMGGPISEAGGTISEVRRFKTLVLLLQDYYRDNEIL